MELQLSEDWLRAGRWAKEQKPCHRQEVVKSGVHRRKQNVYQLTERVREVVGEDVGDDVGPLVGELVVGFNGAKCKFKCVCLKKESDICTPSRTLAVVGAFVGSGVGVDVGDADGAGTGADV